MIVYLDTSAFVKLVLEEDRAVEARSWFDEARPAISSAITYPEACAALARRAREEEVDGARLTRWLNELDVRWRHAVSIRVDSNRAGRLALRHTLRGMDAIHVAAAVHVRERLLRDEAHEEFVFAAFDRRLLEAAEREGFATLGGPLP
jgi:predicted nucleic acid-binding protein